MQGHSPAPRPHPAGTASCAALLTSLLLSACSLQPVWQAPPRPQPEGWSSSAPPEHTAAREAWWQVLGDPGINALVSTGLAASPTLAQAAARVDQAAAALGQSAARRLPALDLQASASRAQSVNSLGTDTAIRNTASAGPSLSWELDLFGRVRESVRAGERRLDARSADAEAARLALSAQLVDNLLQLRNCQRSEATRREELLSREQVLVLVRVRREAGFLAVQDEAGARSLAESASANLQQQAAQCASLTHALQALSGADARNIADWSAPERMPTPPAVPPRLPASLLLAHPDLRAAESDAAAAWADIGAARAARWPRVNLAGALSSVWLGAMGASADFTTWSIGPALQLPLFDGGAGAAGVSAAEARYREAAGRLEEHVRNTVRDVEDAMGNLDAAAKRSANARSMLDAAQKQFAVSESRFDAGALNRLDHEDALRQIAGSQENEFRARTELTRAWVALVKASGNALPTE